jgi:multiple sugar transport system permease protein
MTCSRKLDTTKAKAAGRRTHLSNLLLIFPSIFFLCVLTLYPLAYGIYISFLSFDIHTLSGSFNGLNNYFAILAQPSFIHSLIVTFEFGAAALCIQFPLGLLTAIALNSITRGRRVFLTIILLPMGLAWVIIGLMGRWMFDYSYGLVNFFLGLVGVRPLDWLGNGTNALIALIIIDVWETTPVVGLVFYAGLHSVPQGPIEAAMVDGASRLRILWDVILPIIRPLILFLLAIRTMDALRIFDEIAGFTFGGPAFATETLSLYIYRQAFRYMSMGPGSAGALIFTLMILGLVAFYMVSLYRRELR